MMKNLPTGLALALLCLGCATPLIAPPAGGRCAAVQTLAEARRAVAALEVSAFAQRAMYDAIRDPEAHLFHVPQTNKSTLAVITYPAPERLPGAPAGLNRLRDRSFTYDNALYALWFIAEGDRERAEAVLRTLSLLQRDDGAWGFSFDARGGTFYNAGYVRTGVVAWVTLAFARYALKFGDKQFASVLERSTKWLRQRRDPQTGLLTGGLGRWHEDGARFEPNYVADWAATEHNVDAWFALRAAAKTGIAATNHEALAKAIRTRLFIEVQGRYAQGLQKKGLDRTSALDASGSWSALLEIANQTPIRARQILGWLHRHHEVRDGGWSGFKPYADGPDLWFVEGSLAIALAKHRLGDIDGAKRLTAEVAKLSCVARRPVPYSTSWAKDFPATPAAAPTLWFALVAREVDGGAPAFLWSPR